MKLSEGVTVSKAREDKYIKMNASELEQLIKKMETSGEDKYVISRHISVSLRLIKFRLEAEIEYERRVAAGEMEPFKL